MNNIKLSKTRNFLLVIFAEILVFSANSYSAADYTELAKEYIPKLEKMLKENIAEFWLTKSIDTENGGYIINMDAQGNVKQGGTKMIVTQARTLWLFSRMIRAGYDSDEILKAAEHGYKFLTEKMWDSEKGGFAWEVDATGNQRRQPLKHMYGQAFALYGISEYYLATKKPEVLKFANDFFELLDEKAYDKEYGGYLEFFNEDWTPAPNINNYMGSGNNQKLMNTHLHLLEAFTTYYHASQSELARKRLMELILIETNTVVRKDVGACTDRYERDWTPILTGNFASVSYGHDIENVWLVMDACKAIGQANEPLMDFYKSLYGYSYKHGYDQENGGFFNSGPFNQNATNRTKTWWVQAEALVSALYMYQATGDEKYKAVFEKSFEFVDKFIADWEYGEWHDSTSDVGIARRANKGQAWKCGYHNGRAMIECIEILKAL